MGFIVKKQVNGFYHLLCSVDWQHGRKFTKLLAVGGQTFAEVVVDAVRIFKIQLCFWSVVIFTNNRLIKATKLLYHFDNTVELMELSSITEDSIHIRPHILHDAFQHVGKKRYLIKVE